MTNATSRRLIRRLIGASAVAAATITLIGCGGGHSGASAGPPDVVAHSDHEHADDHVDQHEDGTQANASVDERLAGADLNQLTTNSDLVIRGTITSARANVALVKDDPTAKYTIYRIKVDDLVRGTAGSAVELALLSEIQGAPIVLEERPNPKVGDAVVALLRKIAPEFHQAGYVLTNQSSLMLVKQDGRVVSGIEGSSPVAAEAKALQNVDRIVAKIRAVPQK